MKRWLLLALSAMALASCHTQYRNVRTFVVDNERCRAFLVVKQDWSYPIGYVDRDGDLTFITANLDTLGQIERILPSPDRQRVLIVLYGEGHQFITDRFEVTR